MKLFFSNRSKEKYIAKVVRRSLQMDDRVIIVQYGKGKRTMTVDLPVEGTTRDLYDSMVYCNEQFERYGIDAVADVHNRTVCRYDREYEVQTLKVEIPNLVDRPFFWKLLDIKLESA